MFISTRPYSPSLGDDVEEIERPSPKYKEYIEPSYYNSDEDDDGDWGDIYISRDVYDPPGVDWMAMKKAQEEREGRKLHGKGRVETVKFISTDRQALKHKETPYVDAGTSKEAAVPVSRHTIGARMSVKPQEEWNSSFYFPDPSIMDEEEEDVPRTKVRVRALEIYQKQELLHRASVRNRLEEIEKKNDLLPIVTKFVHRMDTLQSDLRRCYSRITALEETNSKLRTAVSHAMAPH